MSTTGQDTKRCGRCRYTLPMMRFMYRGKMHALCDTCAHSRSHPQNRCRECGIRACFNVEGERYGIYCATHKKPNMVDVKNKRCECGKRASYGIPCNPLTACTQHKEDGMIQNPSRRCRKKDCPNMAEYGVQIPLHCEQHKTEHDISLIERPCTKCGRLDRLRDGLCVNYCCLDEDSHRYRRHQKFREKRVLEMLTAHYRRPDAVGKKVSYACGQRHAEEKEIEYDHGTHKIFVEVDENQHRSYCAEGEIKRMINIFGDEGGVPVLFLRYNPDPSRSNKTPRAKREQEVIRWLRHYEDVSHLHGHPLSVHYLYYDHGLDGKNYSIPVDHVPSEYPCPQCKTSFWIPSYFEDHQKTCWTMIDRTT